MENENKVFIDPDWGEIDFSDLVDEPAMPEADEEAEGAAVKEPVEDNGTETEANPAEESEPQGAEETQDQPEQTGADQLFSVRVLGEDRQLTRDEMITAAQKGLDYDRVKNRYAELQAERDANAPSVNLVKELAEAQGISVEQLITNVKAAALAKKEGISIKAATERVQLQAREDAISKRESVFKQKDADEKKENDERAARNRQFMDFFKNHPGVKPKDIPEQCFKDMRNGKSLEDSYALHTASMKEAEYTKSMGEKDARIKALEERLAALEKQKTSQDQNQINAARSVGSADTAGRSTKQDLFDSLWDDGT